MKKNSQFQIITILLTLLTITVNVLANTLPLNGLNTGEISARFNIYFVPAGYVFAIWLLIYLGLAAFMIFQISPSQKASELIKKITPAYWVASLANSVWIFLWHYEVFPLTLIAMLTLFGSLLFIYTQISNSNFELTNQEKTFVKLPFSIYLGWVSVATIANISQFLFFYDWGGWGISPEIWAVIMIVVASVVGVLMLVQKRDIVFTLVLVWAFVGIAISQANTSVVANTAWATASLLALGIILTPLINRLKS